MINAYINELIEKLNTTEIWKKESCIQPDFNTIQGKYFASGGTQDNCIKKCKDYNEGIQLLLNTFTEHKRKGTQLFFIGNGGSSAIASHMTADFMKNGGMNTYSLYDNAVTTCMGNDYGYEYIFSKPMGFLVRSGDLVTAISSSGNSPNICNAIETAKEKGAEVITFTGFKPDNPAKRLGDINIYVPCEKYGIVESIHNLILQQIVDLIMERDGAEI